ncbi:virion structural protein [Agrobacterium phage Atu_ph07]|uniref:Structural protein n=1 Tax=Agrobacterium phage Atu_ph07 TaxID=2024264 RepID=A0A2L0UZG8_9CAUD|nr:virion structural protein [Agrobacterium phage Atu_ph07]AUZ94962.1 structural protein [Agrobacterium phage Atu_ph07]
MANKLTGKQLSPQFRFSPTKLTVDPEKKRVIKLLPGVNQTETLVKFFSASADHLFQPGKSQPINGYIGRNIDYPEQSDDYYLVDKNPTREFYQFDPAMVSTDVSGNTEAVMFYPDFINKVRFQGGIVNNHNRMFEQKYYSWCPSIDLDKFTNFREYFWLNEGAPAVDVYGHCKKYVGDGVTQMYSLTDVVPFPVDKEHVTVTVDSIPVPFSYDNGNITLNPAPVRLADVRVYTAIDIMSVVGLETFSFAESTTLQSNLRIFIKNDLNPANIGKTFIVEGVGTGIILINDSNPDLTLVPDYFTIARGSVDGNDWSSSNRWFHRSVVGNLDKATLAAAKAKRPIIEFARDTQLYNHGTYRRNKVQLVSFNNKNFFESVSGLASSTVKFDGVTITKQWFDENNDNGEIRVLVTDDSRAEVNNRVYRIRYNSANLMVVTMYADGEDPSGYPIVGDTMEVQFGATYGGTDLYWNGTVWKIAQKKTADNQAPLFTLFDDDNVAIDDESRYPNSTFAGSKIFGYDIGSATFDTVLGIYVKHGENGDFIFRNYLSTETYQYKVGVTTYDITPNIFYKIIKNGENTYTNDWYLADGLSKQYVIDRFVAANGSRLYTASQEPAAGTPYFVYKNGMKLREGSDYIRQYNQFLFVTLEDGDKIEIHTFNPLSKANDTPGFYQIPLNLQANPLWQSIETATKGDLFGQISEVIAGQVGFKGTEYSTNNWKDIKHSLNIGTRIVSNTAPLPLTMLLASNEETDFIKAVRYSEMEYARFRSKFEKKIKEYIVDGKFNSNDPIGKWVDAALDDLSRGFTKEFPFFTSRMANTSSRPERNFIPVTPSWIGAYPIQEPSVYTDSISGESFIVGHDGSYMPLSNDVRDQANLELEKRIYESAPQFVKDKQTGFLDYKDFTSSAFYTGSYSVNEENYIYRSMFEKWCVNFSVEYKKNKSFNANDPFTWNYSTARDFNNNPVPGNWRGIYRLYYGTDRPNTHPWEMLGFSVKPEWWENKYGVAPYGADNYILWRDIQNGTIADGIRKGTDARYAIPNLLNMIPVDDQGKLLDPVASGIVRTAPNLDKAGDDWKWGDGAPAEAAWRKSYWFPFAKVQASYLMKPPVVIETLWDTERATITEGTAGRGYPYKDQYVYGETNNLGVTVYPYGIQQWLYDFIHSKNINITEVLGKKVRGLDVKLSYKIGGYTDKNSLFVISDTLDRLPTENVKVELYRSPSIREEFVGGIIVQSVGNAWKVYGYDLLDPVFKTIPPDFSGKTTNVSINSTRRTNILEWKSSVYYSKSTQVRYNDLYYACTRTHTSGRLFDTQYWQAIPRPSFANDTTVPFYHTPNKAMTVERFEYGSTIRNVQDMSVLLSGYQLYLESRGWVFDKVSNEEGDVYNWRSCLREFMSWVANKNTKEFDTIILFPSKDLVKFETEHGTIEPIEQTVNGVYSVLDQNGFPIQPYNTNVIREDGKLTVTSRTDQEILSVRLSVSEMEHIILIDNTTIFGDKIYDPLFNSRQTRVRLQGFKTDDWKGRIDAPGFLITGNVIRPNFEKSADNIRRMFDIESVESSELMERARLNIGYYEKPYLDNLLITKTNQFEFYQGLIQQKGTVSALHKIFRSNFIRHNESTKFLEEWAFRIGDYGYSSTNKSMDFVLKQEDFTNNPQLIDFVGAGQGGWDLRLGWDDEHWDYINPKEKQTVRYTIGGISNVKVTNPGRGYRTAPSVEVVGGANNATFNVSLDWSVTGIESIQVVRGGTGFFEGDLLNINGNGYGATAKVSSVNYQSSKIIDIYVDVPAGQVGAGSGYKVGDSIRVYGGNNQARGKVTEVSPTGAILKVSVTQPGGGYTKTNPVVSFVGTNWSAQDGLKFRVSGGAISGVEVTSSGQGYDDSTFITFNGTGTGAILDVATTGAKVNFVEVVNPGTGFETTPVLKLIGDSTEEATIEAEIQTESTSGVINLASFKRTNGINIEKITVSVFEEFNGIQPILSVGDESDNERYVSNISISEKGIHIYELDAEGITTNFDLDINVYVKNASISGNVQIDIEYKFTPDYYNEIFATDDRDTNVLNIVDLFDNTTGQFVYRDPRWIWRHDTHNPDWALKNVSAYDKGNLPSAGYVHLGDVQWTATDYNNFLAIYSDAKTANPPVDITNDLTVTYKGGVTGTSKTVIIKKLSKGTYRVKNFVIDVENAFNVDADDIREFEISIGTLSNPELYMSRDTVKTDRIYTHTQQVFNYLFVNDDSGNEIFVYTYQRSGLAAAPGKLTVTANLEVIKKNVLPGDNAWCYDVANGDWSVFRLGDTSANVVEARPASFEGQGSVVATDRNMFTVLGIEHNWFEPIATADAAIVNPNFFSDFTQFEDRMSRVVLDGVETSSGDAILGGTYKTKVNNTANIYVDAAEQLISGTATSNQIDIMDLIGASEIVINKITASVVRPFNNPAGVNPTVKIGTRANPSRFIGSVSNDEAIRSVRTAPTRPTFLYSKPISVDIWDNTMTVFESEENAIIRLIRTGNIFVTPSSIVVKNSGWGYSYDSMPKVTVLGPTGVKATAHIEGTIVGYTVVDGGNGYTSTPSVSVIGGQGQGAKAVANISNGKIVSVTIPGAGTGSSATATIAGGSLTGVTAVAGSGWEMVPIITFEGGAPQSHGVVTASLDTNGGISSITIDGAGSGYLTAPNVKINPWTGIGYKSKPTIIVGGGNGAGAIIEPVMMWRVTSITIDDWGKCSWTGENGQVLIEPPLNGGAPIAEIIAVPEVLEPTTIAQWRKRVISPPSHPNYGVWDYVDETITFNPPTNASTNEYWLQSFELPLGDIEENVTYEVNIPDFVSLVTETDDGIVIELTDTPNVTNGTMGDTVTAYINVVNNVAGSRDIDLKVAGTLPSFILNDRILEDDKMIIYYDGDGATNGLLTISVDYHYLNGFELFEQDGTPQISASTGTGGDVFAWNTVRFADMSVMNEIGNLPVDGWTYGTKVWLDDGRNARESAVEWKPNVPYAYHDLVKVNGFVYRSIEGGYGLEATIEPKSGQTSLAYPVITNKGTKYTADPKVTISGDGNGAEASVRLAPTSLYKIIVKNPDTNSGYVGTETIIITPKHSAGRNAQAVISSVVDGSIKEVSIINSGWGYDSTPIVEIENDQSTNKVEFDVILNPAVVKDILMENRGENYTTATMSFTDERNSMSTFDERYWESTTESEAKWKVKEFTKVINGDDWNTIREETPMVDSSLIKSAYIYDVDTQETLQTLQLFDPYKGIIPGSVEKELTYIIEYDPAIYNRGPLLNENSQENSWNNIEEGSLWWDISTTRYLDYEIDSDDYKWRNWGHLAPGITIDIYEWTRSTVSPDNWADTVLLNRNVIFDRTQQKPTGEVKDIENPSYVVRSEYNKENNRMETVYYFWVKNATSLPVRTDRTLTATQVASILQNPFESDIPWFAVISANKIIVGGSKVYVNNTSTALHLEWKTVDNDGLFHKQWQLVRDEDDRKVVDVTLWDKMRDSLVGWNTNVDNRVVKTTTKNRIDAETTEILVEDASEFSNSGEFKLTDYWITYNYKVGNVLKEVSGLGNLSFPSGMTIEQTQSISNPNKVPDQWLGEKERYGNLNIPLQTWFKVDIDEYGYFHPSKVARKAFVETLNDIFSRDAILNTRFEWVDIFRTEDAKPKSTEFNFEVDSEDERDDLVAFGEIKEGQVVLMNGVENTYGFWTLWKYQPSQTASTNGFVMIDAQNWRLQEGELWEAVDWYAEGWSSNDFPIRRFETIKDRDAAGNIDIGLLKGTLVKVDRRSETDPRWVWNLYTNDGWIEVACEKATIKLKDDFYKPGTFVYGFGNHIINNIGRRDGSWELQKIIDGLWTKVLTDRERNELFFSMVQTAVSQHQYTDWAFKTSFLYMAGYNEELLQTPFNMRNQTENVLEFVEDAKPYHVKIRDYVRRLSVPMDTVNVTVTDFDKPLYFDQTINNGAGGWRKLDPSDPFDVNILKNDSRFKWWYNNYQKTNYNLNEWDENWNPVRRYETTILFDRVSCKAIVGWDQLELPWDGTETRWKKDQYFEGIDELIAKYQTDNTRTYEYFIVKNSIERDDMIRTDQNLINAGEPPKVNMGDIITQTDDSRFFMWSGTEWVEFWSVQWDKNHGGGAADRIYEYYEPTFDMKKKDMDILIKGCSYRGTIIDGGNLSTGLWDMFEWDHNSGWDNEYAFYIGDDLDINPNRVSFNEDLDGPADIQINGGELAQPWFEANHPDEQVKAYIRSPIIMNVYRQATVTGSMQSPIPLSFRFFKDSFGGWTGTYTQDNVITLAEDLTSTANEIVIMQSGGLTLHDPNNTDPAYIEYVRSKVKLSYSIDTSSPITVKQFKAISMAFVFGLDAEIEGKPDNEDITSLVEAAIDRFIINNVEGVVWIGTERIVYTGVDYSQSANDIYTLTGVTRGTKGTSRPLLSFVGEEVIDGSSLHNLKSFNVYDMRVSSVQEYTANWTSWIEDAQEDGIPGITP